jgi:hypothetical protein
LKKCYIGVAAVLMIMPALLLSAPTTADTAEAKWTVMIYMDGDNNVESYALDDLSELEEVGSSEDVNIVVLLDTYQETANLLYVESPASTVIENWGEPNMGDPATLTAFIDAAEAMYPADKYALVMWDHGGGIGGLCWDDDNDGDRLRMDEFRAGIVDAGLAFDVIVLNACVMATAEIAHQMVGYADYMVFSQENMYAVGFPYDLVADSLVSDADMTGEAFCLMMTAHYRDQFIELGWSGVTISVYDMACVDSVAGAVGAFGNAQKATVATYYKEYKTLRRLTPAPNNAADLITYATLVRDSEVIADGAVKSSAQAVITAVDEAIIYEWHSEDVESEHGLGIWFPTKSVKYYWSDSYEEMYRGLLFDGATGWADFLDTYYNKG